MKKRIKKNEEKRVRKKKRRCRVFGFRGGKIKGLEKMTPIFLFLYINIIYVNRER